MHSTGDGQEIDVIQAPPTLSGHGSAWITQVPLLRVSAIGALKFGVSKRPTAMHSLDVGHATAARTLDALMGSGIVWLCHPWTLLMSPRMFVVSDD